MMSAKLQKKLKTPQISQTRSIATTVVAIAVGRSLEALVSEEELGVLIEAHQWAGTIRMGTTMVHRHHTRSQKTSPGGESAKQPRKCN